MRGKGGLSEHVSGTRQKLPPASLCVPGRYAAHPGWQSVHYCLSRVVPLKSAQSMNIHLAYGSCQIPIWGDRWAIGTIANHPVGSCSRWVPTFSPFILQPQVESQIGVGGAWIIAWLFPPQAEAVSALELRSAEAQPNPVPAHHRPTAIQQQ